jgi:protein-disulfide isomerase
MLIEYSDFQCPYCAVVHTTLRNVILENKGSVAWIYRHFPLPKIHPQAIPAAHAAECVAEQRGNAGFWKFADGIYANQRRVNSTTFSTLASQVGANLSEFNSCIGSRRHQSKIEADMNDASKNGGTGTPFIVVYGYGKQIPVNGAASKDTFLNAVKSVRPKPSLKDLFKKVN